MRVNTQGNNSWDGIGMVIFILILILVFFNHR